MCGRVRLREWVENYHFAPSLIHRSTHDFVYQVSSLTTNILKPFPNASRGAPEVFFYYHPSKTRRIVENAFGRLNALFRFIMTKLESTSTNANQTIKVSCILHNMCYALNDSIFNHS